VKAPRYGEGVVARIKGDEVSVRFPDKSLRTFVAEFLKKVRGRRTAASRRASARPGAVA
jgi:hypothetical protein